MVQESVLVVPFCFWEGKKLVQLGLPVAPFLTPFFGLGEFPY